MVLAASQAHHGQEQGPLCSRRPGKHLEATRLDQPILELIGLGGNPVPKLLEREQPRPSAVADEDGLTGGEARPAVADARPQKMVADPVVEPHPSCYLEHIGARFLAHVRDLVDE